MVNIDDITTGMRVRYTWREFKGTGIIRELVPNGRVAVKCDDISLIVLVPISDISLLATENLPPLKRKGKA